MILSTTAIAGKILWEDLKYTRQFKDMDWNSLCNKSGNFDYTYVWYLGKWYLLKNEKRKPLKDLI